ncbi:uncharacterized protein LOC122061176 [Macadamia integrifolia]|uniref:uncharacterized protein LOC122061176 n=1 Tax=Macadamia integrifolia TaxID=60698 RepID=UPI001C52B93B|nr:uncharacterized protein LOC122061176 [Macadamia integrifolia]
MATSHILGGPPSNLLELHIVILSAKHLKNVNWRHGDLKPYVLFCLEPRRRFATKTDESGSVCPVWNERFTLPINLPFQDSLLTLDIYHSKPSETVKPLVGNLQFPLKELSVYGDFSIRTLELRRPSGRIQGKIRLKLAIRERLSSPDYYSSAPPPPPPSRYIPFLPTPPLPLYPSGSYSDPYSGNYSGYYSHPPPVPWPLFDRVSAYGGLSGHSAASYDRTGLAVGGVAGALERLALEERMKYEDERMPRVAAERFQNDLYTGEDYSEYPVDY